MVSRYSSRNMNFMQVSQYHPTTLCEFNHFIKYSEFNSTRVTSHSKDTTSLTYNSRFLLHLNSSQARTRRQTISTLTNERCKHIHSHFTDSFRRVNSFLFFPINDSRKLFPIHQTSLLYRLISSDKEHLLW